MKTVCQYCGCACDIDIKLQENKTQPVQESLTKPCLKGLYLHESIKNNRLTDVLWRKSKKDTFTPISHNKALQIIQNKLHNTVKKYGPDSVYFISSGEYSNETNYLIHKLARKIGTQNVDSCARLCHAATGYVWKQSFGITGIPKYTVQDVSNANLYVYFGSDPAENYSSLFYYIRNAVNKHEAKLITVDVMPSATYKLSSHGILVKPSDITIFLILTIRNLLKNPLITNRAQAIEGYQELNKTITLYEDVLKSYDDFYGTSAKQLANILLEHFSNGQKIVIGYGMGITQHFNGVQNVAAVTNISILLNAILFPGRGKVNVQGCDDIKHCFDDQSSNFVPMSEALYQKDKIKFLWITGMNPFHSFPALKKLKANLKDTFIVLMHHHKTESQRYANVVLPVGMLVEEGGTIVNMERRLKLVNPIGIQMKNVQSSWKIFGRILNDSYDNIWDITSEWVKRTDLLGETIKSLSTSELIKRIRKNDVFMNKEPKHTKLLPIILNDYYRLANRSEDFPYMATTARSRVHFCSGETTRSSKTLSKLEQSHVAYINKTLGNKLGVKSGDTVKVISSEGEIKTVVKIVSGVANNTIVLSYHFEKPLVNNITPLILDPLTKTPQFKYIPVKIVCI